MLSPSRSCPGPLLPPETAPARDPVLRSRSLNDYVTLLSSRPLWSTSQKFFRCTFGHADRPRQRELCQVVLQRAVYKCFITIGHRFLRLYHFDIVRYPGAESVL